MGLYQSRQHAPEFTTTERVARVTLQLLEGRRMTTAEIASESGVTWQGAERMLERISRVVPITKYNGQWLMVE